MTKAYFSRVEATVDVLIKNSSNDNISRKASIMRESITFGIKFLDYTDVYRFPFLAGCGLWDFSNTAVSGALLSGNNVYKAISQISLGQILFLLKLLFILKLQSSPAFKYYLGNSNVA